MINSESLVFDEVRTTMFSLSVAAHRVTNYEAASDGGKWGVSMRKMKLTLTGESSPLNDIKRLDNFPLAHLNLKFLLFHCYSDIKAIYIINYATKAFTISLLHFRFAHLSLGAPYYLRNMYPFILLKFNARDISPVVASRKRNPQENEKIITSNSCAETKFSHDVINIFGSTRKFIIILLCYVFLLLHAAAQYAPTKIKKLSRHKNKFRLSCFRYPRGEIAKFMCRGMNVNSYLQIC